MTSKNGRGGSRYLPIVFTEHGVLQLSSVLRSDVAKKISIRIIEVFVKLRQIQTEHSDLRLEIEKIKHKLDKQGENMDMVFKYLDELIEKKKATEKRQPIGYKAGKQD